MARIVQKKYFQLTTLVTYMISIELSNTSMYIEENQKKGCAVPYEGLKKELWQTVLQP